MDIGLLAFGAYLPRSRLRRTEIARAHAWFAPGLKGLAKGERTAANWDEDPVTMAVEAARNCLDGLDRAEVSALWLASTSLPFRDRQNAGIVADALCLKGSTATMDIASSQRAGTTALATALRMADDRGPVLVAAAEKRKAKAAGPQEMTYGDGAVAFLVGSGDVVARLLGAHTESVDFVDHYRGESEEFDYAWEERWVRDEGHLKIAPRAITALLEQTGVAPGDVARFCYPTAARGVSAGIARKLGLPEGSVADNLQSICGETGAAHSLLMLAHALETARPGDRILVAGFGQGCDALLFEATEALTQAARTEVSGQLAHGRADVNYLRHLKLNDLMIVEQGIRAETDKGTGLSAHFRNKDMAQRMMGGRCTECGTNQFPKSRICVSPHCGAVNTQIDEPFAEKIGRLNSFTADRLTFSPDPPAYYGMVEFSAGGRLFCDFTDIADESDLKVGMAMRMMFRVKDYDDRRGFRRYFWKATPVEPASNESEGE